MYSVVWPPAHTKSWGQMMIWSSGEAGVYWSLWTFLEYGVFEFWIRSFEF